MALELGINSYVDGVGAELYFENRIDVAAWSVADPVMRDQALVMATATLEELPWVGRVRDSSQPLCWPRIGSINDISRGEAIVFDEAIPLRVIKACYELAYHYLNNDGIFDDTGSVVSLDVDVIHLTGIKAPARIPSIAKKLLAPYLSQTRGTWWRAN
jgi:hypothetical protein